MKSVLLVAAGLLLPVGIALAQPPAGPPGADWRAHREQDEAARQQDAARDLSIVLGLRPSQQPALATWLASMHPATGMKRRDGAATPPTTTPEMLADKQARMAEMQQAGASRMAATRTFYAALDSHQQQVFDALDRLRHDLRGPHGDGHGRGGHHPGGPDMPPPDTPG